MQQPKQYDMPTLAVGTPYRENSIVAIARSASSVGRLDAFFTTLHSARTLAWAQRVPVFGPKYQRELGRRAFAGVDARRIESVATWPELGHIAAVRLFGRRKPMWGRDLMYGVKSKFDAGVARRLGGHPPDIVIGMYGASLESFQVAHRHGAMTVLNFVNSHPVEHNHYLTDLAGISATHHELIPRWMFKRVEDELELSDVVLVPSRFVEAQLLEHGIARDKIATIPYGVDLQAFSPREALHGFADAPRGSTPLTCLYVGQISHRKGVRILLEAARRCSRLPIRFRLVGPLVSPEILLNLPENVIYSGTSLPEGVAQSMRDADMFVLPSLEDACALVGLEAMASALPVVTTTHNGSSELIEDRRNGLIIPPGDPTELAQAITRLVDDAGLRQRLGAAARLTVQKAHDWQSYGTSVLNVLDKYYEGPRSGVVQKTTAS